MAGEGVCEGMKEALAIVAIASALYLAGYNYVVCSIALKKKDRREDALAFLRNPDIFNDRLRRGEVTAYLSYVAAVALVVSGVLLWRAS